MKKSTAEQYRRLANLPQMKTEGSDHPLADYIDTEDSANNSFDDPTTAPDTGFRVAMYECGSKTCFNDVLPVCDNVPPESFGDESADEEEDRAVGWADMIILAGPCSPCGLPHEHVKRLERWCRGNVLRGTFVCVIDTSGTQNAGPVAAQVSAFCCHTGAVFAGDGYVCQGYSEDDSLSYAAGLAEMCAPARARVSR